MFILNSVPHDPSLKNKNIRRKLQMCTFLWLWVKQVKNTRTKILAKTDLCMDHPWLCQTWNSLLFLLPLQWNSRCKWRVFTICTICITTCTICLNPHYREILENVCVTVNTLKKRCHWLHFKRHEDHAFKNFFGMIVLVSVQLLSLVQLFVIPWTAPRQASLSITNSWNSPKLMSIDSVAVDQNGSPWPGAVITDCMSCLTIGGPDKEHEAATKN